MAKQKASHSSRKRPSTKNRHNRSQKPASASAPRKERQASASAFANWGGQPTILHYLFLIGIFFGINGFNISATIGGPPVADHLFIKNYAATMLLVPTTVFFLIFAVRQSKRIELVWNATSKLLVGFFIYAALSLFWADNVGFTVTKLTIWWVGLLAYFWAYDLVRRGGLTTLLQVIFFGGVGVAAIGLWQVYFEVSPVAEPAARQSGQYQRLVDMAAGPSSTFGNRNMANHLIVLTAPIAIYLIGASHITRAKVLYFIGLAMMLLFSFHTQTRSAYMAISIEIFALLIFLVPGAYRIGAYLGSLLLAVFALWLLEFNQIAWYLFAILVVFFSVLFFWPKIQSSPVEWKPQYTIYAILVGAITFVLSNYSYFDGTWWVPFWDVLLGRAEATNTGMGGAKVLDDIGNGASNLRFQIWSDSIPMIQESWRSFLFGHSLGGFYPTLHFDAYDMVQDRAIRYAHNEYIGLFVELGLIGIIFLLALIALALKMALSAYRMLIDERYTFADKKTKILLIAVIVFSALGCMINSGFSFPFEYVSPYMVISSYLAILAWLVADTSAKMTDSRGEEAQESESLAKSQPIKALPFAQSVLITVLVSVISIGSMFLNQTWSMQLTKANTNMSLNRWSKDLLPDSPWLMHANYYWLYPAFMGVFERRGDCDAVYRIADSILKFDENFFEAASKKAFCGDKVRNFNRRILLFSNADLQSTYGVDSAWSNVLNLGLQSNVTLIYDHLEKMEAHFETRPALVKHRYANSLGRRFQEFANEQSGDKQAQLFEKAITYLSLAVEQLPENTKYKADLAFTYLDANQPEKAREVLEQIKDVRPESRYISQIEARLAP